MAIAVAIVDDVGMYRAVRALEADRDMPGAAMAHDIRDAFAHGPGHDGLDVG
jgi:hypothetical protein